MGTSTAPAAIVITAGVGVDVIVGVCVGSGVIVAVGVSVGGTNVAVSMGNSVNSGAEITLEGWQAVNSSSEINNNIKGFFLFINEAHVFFYKFSQN